MDDLVQPVIRKLIKKYHTNCPFQLSAALGIQVRYADLGKTTKGLYFRKLRRRFIVIHTHLPAEWQRFVCAHELGHDRLHKGISRLFLEEHSYFCPGKLERQANRFAIALLTADLSPIDEESAREFYLRAGIPQEFLYFFDV